MRPEKNAFWTPIFSPLQRLISFLYCFYSIFWFLFLMIFVLGGIYIFEMARKYHRGIVYRLCKLWAAAWMFLSGIQFRRIAIANPDLSQQYVFVANHVSYLDIPAILRTLKNDFTILGKSELSSVPLFGEIYKRAVISVSRESSSSRVAALKLMTEELQGGRSVLVFPEGSFNETNDPLKEFEDGAFKLAARHNVPICPIVLPDTIRRLHYGSVFSLSPGECRAVILPAIYPAGRSNADAEDLKKKTFKEMEICLIEFRKVSWN